MYFILKRGKLKEIISLALDRSGSFRKLEADVSIPKSCLFIYFVEKRAIKKDYLDKLLNYLNITINREDIIKELPDNWKQTKGGKNCVIIKKRNGTFEKQLKQFQNKTPEALRLWHKKLKREDPKKYYLSQYERFKKIGTYKFITNNKEKVRNKLEKDVADLLKGLNRSYKYEPLVKVADKYFFPDFLIDEKIILECTAWRGLDKAIKLKEKISYLKKNYKVYVVIPKTLKRYYETLNQYLILGIDNIPKMLKSG